MTASAAALALSLAAIASMAGTALFLPFTRKLGWLDTPDHRSAHARATPGSGGLAIVAALLVTLALLLLGDRWQPLFRDLLMLPLVATLCVIGALDDRRPLAVALRLPLYLLIAGLAVWSVGLPAGVPLWSAPILILGLAWVLNLYNFMDGIDGIAALQCLLTAAGLSVLGFLSGADPAFVLAAAVIAGAYAGFAVFNWPPARLFMGDAGSLSAGLLLGWLGLWSLRDAILPAGVWLLLMSPFLLDTGLTLARRALRGERLTQAHNTHLYQRLARHWESHKKVDLALLGLHLLLLQPLAVFACSGVLSPWTSLALGLFPQLLLIAKYRRLK
jgi:Fuc2NAc and GlcNAc transferase